MDQHTFRSKLAELIQKSRKALRLYSTLGQRQSGGTSSEEQSELSDVQVQEWREVNGDLLRSLSSAVGRVSQKEVAGDVFALRDRFQVSWRSHEASLHSKQQGLIGAAEKGDFIKAALLSRELVTLRARVQASQAAFHELDLLFGTVRSAPVELSNDQIVPATDTEPGGAVVAEGQPLFQVDGSNSKIAGKHELVTAELRRLGTPQQIGSHQSELAGKGAKVLRFRKVS